MADEEPEKLKRLMDKSVSDYDRLLKESGLNLFRFREIFVRVMSADMPMSKHPILASACIIWRYESQQLLREEDVSEEMQLLRLNALKWEIADWTLEMYRKYSWMSWLYSLITRKEDFVKVFDSVDRDLDDTE